MNQINTQKPSKQIANLRDHYQVHSIFSTIQGEGPYAGMPATFIRLGGCNLQCPLCDTDYTKGVKDVDLVVLLKEVFQHKSHLVVITGGEPFRQNFTKLAEGLVRCGYLVQAETNGTLYVEGFPYEDVTIVCSPKTASIHPKLRPFIDAYKYVGGKDTLENDGLPKTVLGLGKRSVARPPSNFKGPVFLQAVDVQDESLNNQHLDAVVNSCLKNKYNLCLQVHKIINVE